MATCGTQLDTSLPYHGLLIISIVIIIYDWLITIREEVNLFWNRRFSGASILFLCNRYFVLAIFVLYLFGFMNMPDEVRQIRLTALNAEC